MPNHGKGPPRKPDALKRLEGTYRKDRTSKNPPKFPGSTPRPPKELNAAAKAEWKRLSPQLAELGMLTPADKALFGVYCQAFADYWKLTAELNAMGSWSQHNARSGSLTPVLFQNSAERKSVSLQGFGWPVPRHSRATWRVLEPFSGARASEGIWGEVGDDST